MNRLPAGPGSCLSRPAPRAVPAKLPRSLPLPARFICLVLSSLFPALLCVCGPGYGRLRAHSPYLLPLLVLRVGSQAFGARFLPPGRLAKAWDRFSAHSLRKLPS